MAMTLITTNTTSNAASSAFTSSIDGTYKLYVFSFYNVNPVTSGADFEFDGSVDTGSNYGVTKTTTLFLATHAEDGSAASLGYRASNDVANAADEAVIARGIDEAADASVAGTLWLFNPSNTTYVKHFIYTANSSVEADAFGSDNFYGGGYLDTTSAIDAVKFSMSSGNLDAVIKMYGVG